MSKVIERTELFYSKDTSDKEYNVEIVEVADNRYDVKATYGRCGNASNEHKLTKHGPVSISDANDVYEMQVRKKRQKGYQISHSTNLA